MYVLEFFGPLAGRCGTVVVRPGERLGYERSEFVVLVHPGLRFSFFFNRSTLNDRSKILCVSKMAATVYEETTALAKEVMRYY